MLHGHATVIGLKLIYFLRSHMCSKFCQIDSSSHGTGFSAEVDAGKQAPYRSYIL